MIDRATWKRWLTHPVVDWTVFVLGLILILLSPVVGALPGPGGVFVLALGLAMVLRTSQWARRRYVEFKRWQPKAGRWTDWGMRRKSALRREKIKKDQKAADQALIDRASLQGSERPDGRHPAVGQVTGQAGGPGHPGN